MNKVFIILFFILGNKVLAEKSFDCKEAFESQNIEENGKLKHIFGNKKTFYTLEEGKEFFKRKGFQNARQFQILQREARLRLKKGEGRLGDEEFLRILTRSGIDAKWKLKEKGIQFASLFLGRKNKFYILEEAR